MFDQLSVEASDGGKKPMSLLLSLTLQAGIVCVLIGIPLLYTQALPGTVLKSLFVSPSAPHTAHADSSLANRPAKFVPRLLNIRQLAPPSVFARINAKSRSMDAPEIGATISSGSVGDGNDLPGGNLIGSAPEAPAPEPPATKSKAAAAPLRAGSGFEAANLIYKVIPVYPSLAKATRVQGTVEFTARISKSGTIENLQLVHGHPLLVSAAKEAVLQWKYRPTYLNGVPVEVITDILVNFTLSQ